MKGILLLVLDLQSEDLDAAVAAALEPFRLDQDDLASIRNHHWDYWLYGATDLADPAVARIVQTRDATAYQHASFIRHLPEGYVASGLIDPAGTWHDLQDCGWSMVNEPSPQNEAAMREWTVKFTHLKQQYHDLIGVEVRVHC